MSFSISFYIMTVALHEMPLFSSPSFGNVYNYIIVIRFSIIFYTVIEIMVD